MKTQIGDNCWYNCKPPICSIPNVKLSHSFTPPEQQKNTTRVFLLLPLYDEIRTFFQQNPDVE